MRVSKWLWRKLGRVTSGGALIPQIDGLRFVAIMAVLLFHMHYLFVDEGMAQNGWQAAVDHIWLSGYFGVKLFFIISGFILALPFARNAFGEGKKPRLKNYYWRRVTRLEPPYVISLSILLIYGLLAGTSLGEIVPHFLASVFYVHYFVYGEPSTLQFVAWSLEIEVQFYLLAPLLTRVFVLSNRWQRRAIIVAVAYGFFFWSHLAWEPFVDRTLIGQLPYFLIGFLLCDLWLNEWKEVSRHKIFWDVAGLLAWGLLPFCVFSPKTGGHPPMWVQLGVKPVILFIAYSAAFRGALWPRFFSLRPVVVIGGMCYTIYLFHNQLIQIVIHGIFDAREWTADYNWRLAAVPLVVFLVVAASAGLFLLVEKPFMDKEWPKKVRAWWREKRAV